MSSSLPHASANDGGPQRLVGSGVFYIAVGRGKRFLSGANKLTDTFLGGSQIGATYEWHPGPLINFSNLFYHGELQNITNVTRTWDSWFNAADFEKVAAKGPAAFHRECFRPASTIFAAT